MQQDGLLTLRSAGITALQRESENIPHESLDLSIARSSHLVLSHQHREGFWWYTLEANESINAEYILLMHYLDAVDEPAQAKLARRLLSSQTDDGSWPIYFGGPGDLSVTIECYLALKLSGQGLQSESMLKACQFILSKGGLSQCRVFTRIHLALFALIPWEACPSMPLPFVNFPVWFPVSIYEFSSWARACIVPLLIILNKKKMRPLPADFLFELYVEKFPKDCDWSYKIDKGNFTLEKFFIEVDKLLRKFDKIPVKPLKRSSLEACEEWIREHVSRTEDIYPALAYAAMALHNLGRPMDDPTIQKALNALKSFQMETGGDDLHPLPSKSQGGNSLYQQCCVSPVWDSPWAAMALLESGVSPHHESLLKAARWLISKQILDTYGDWSFKNSKALPGGWSFEFENDYFPDVDDTIEVLHFLSRVALPYQETKLAMERGLNWLVSMQSRNGGWAAFDMDNVKEFVNKIPFSDHGACLDPPHS